MKRSGDRFEIFKDKNTGLWHWHLWASNSPSITPTGKSGRGYKSRPQVIKAVDSARRAAIGAKVEPVEVDKPYGAN
jgi:uncharacterized protein YegP (UPF0339 family)